MIVIDAMDVVFFGFGAVMLVIGGIVFVIDRIVCAVKKKRQKRIDKAYKEADE